MKDTPDHIHHHQLAIFQAMTPGRRIEICLEMMEEGRQLVLDQLSRQHPDWTQGQLIAGLTERLYRREFSAEKMAAVQQSIIDFHDKVA